MTLETTAKALFTDGHDLIVLEKNGKKPIQRAWTTRPRNTGERLKRALDEGHNLGVRLKDTDLVIDVDVKNDAQGELSWKRMCKNFPELSDLPRTTSTPSGGFHVWLLKDHTYKITKTNRDYPGIDFLSKGAQVLIGGCTTEVGVYKNLGDGVHHFAPINMLEDLNAPSPTTTEAQLTGVWDNDQLNSALEAIDPLGFRGDDHKWASFAMSCHAVTGGVGRDAWLDWAQTDPQYADESFRDMNGQRWDSFSANKEGGVTGLTLLRQLNAAGNKDMAEELAVALQDADTMFDIESNPEADKYENMMAVIREWDRPHSMEQLYYKIVELNFTDSTLDHFVGIIAKQFGIGKITIRKGLKSAGVLIAKHRGDDSKAIGDEAELIWRMLKHLGHRTILESEGRLWMHQKKDGYYRPLGDRDVRRTIKTYADEQQEELGTGALPRLAVLLESSVERVEDEFWDVAGAGDVLINTKAGVVTMVDYEWELVPHNKEFRLRNVTNYRYTEGTAPPAQFLAWLDSAFPADERNLMARRLAVGLVYSLMSCKPFLKKSWMLYGPPNTGKSMFLHLVRYIVGSGNASTTYLKQMTGAHGVAPLVGKMVNLQGEIDVSERVDAATFKGVVSGDPMEANPKNQQQFTFCNRAVLWLAGNNLPQFAADTTSGVLDRIVPVSFSNPVAPENKDTTLLDKFKLEASQIVEWALWIFNEEMMFDFPCLQLREGSEDELAFVSEMSASPISNFVSEMLEVTGDFQDFTSNKALRSAYDQWISHLQAAPSQSGSISFGRDLSTQLKTIPGLRKGEDGDYFSGMTTTVPRVRGYYGIALKGLDIDGVLL
jgi:P4 family phage/plasmid primase-like protien